MTLVELKIDVGRVADALEKIVFLLEKLVLPPQPADVQVHQATLDDLHVVSPEDVERIHAEQADFAERYRVVPNSPAMAREIMAWEAEQRKLYGEDWEAPEDWKAIFARSYAQVASSASPDGD